MSPPTKKESGKAAPQPTKESRIVAAALEAATKEGITRAAIAEQVGVTAGMLYQWARGMRPVAPEKAADLANALGVSDPASISLGYAESVAKAVGANIVMVRDATRQDEAPADLAIARLQNDVHALSIALGTLSTVMVAHRPAEAAAAAAAIRRNVPSKWKDQGILQELLKVLERAS